MAIDATDLGLWNYEIATGALVWSDRMKGLFGLPSGARVDFETCAARFAASIHSPSTSPSAGRRKNASSCWPPRSTTAPRTCWRWSKSCYARQAPAPSGSSSAPPRDGSLRWRAHVALSEQRWEGADLRRLIEEELAPHRAQNPARVRLAGPSIALSARPARSCAMVLHELVTNAAKYGALSAPEGCVHCAWTATPDCGVALTWNESGGPPVVPPARHGFGMNVIERSSQEQLEGEVRFQWRYERLCCMMALPASSVSG